MAETFGFVKYGRKEAPYRPAGERVRDYLEVTTTLSEDELREQALRCMECGIPFCHALGCPVNHLIPEWNAAVSEGRWQEAYRRLSIMNNFPEITGRVCPAPCEAACTLAANSAAVTIKQLELAVVERAFREGWVLPRPPQRESGKRVAVIGSGPAGLAAAQQLRRAGHAVTVFEKSPRAGGLLRYGIPDFKLDKQVLDRRISQLVREGIEFETDVNAGIDVSAHYLRRRFDAILITMGAGTPRDLKVPGRDLGGIHFAMDYLTASNRSLAGEALDRESLSAAGKSVLVIGGGDTGADCVGTANRQGASRVLQYEIMPKPREWQESRNPEWPDWPRILRTSSSHTEGCLREWAVATREFSGDGAAGGSGNNVAQGTFIRVVWESSGKGYTMKEIPGSEFSEKIDLVLLAMGFVHVEHTRLHEDLELAYDERGNIKVDRRHMTSVSGVFAAGDAATGASLVVRAISHGRTAAEAVDAYLCEGASLPR